MLGQEMKAQKFTQRPYAAWRCDGGLCATPRGWDPLD